MTDLPIPYPSNEEPLIHGKRPSLHEVLPTFSATEIPPVYLENTRYDAQLFVYQQPLTELGEAGYIVDYGYRLGYFPSTWQGQPNRSLLFKDLQWLFDIAAMRQRNDRDFNHPQLGRWSRQWKIGGSDEALLAMANKINVARRQPAC